MSTLKLFLLGSPRVERDGKLIEIPRHKALALLAFLAITRERYSRDALASLLWPEADASHARGALRRALSDIGKALSKSIFDTTGESIAVKANDSMPGQDDLWVDVHSFHALVAASGAHSHSNDTPCMECVTRLTEAATLYRDDFMQGFTLPDCPQFDEWQFFQTETCRQELAVTLERLVRDLMALGNADQALLYARRWSALDPLLEAPQRAIVKLYASSGQRSAALRQFREYSRILQEELGAQPRQELVNLAESIRRGEKSPDQQSSWQSTKPESRSVPQDEIRFVTVLFVGLEQGDSQHPDTLADSADQLEQIVADSASRYDGHVGPFLGEGVQVLFGFAQMHEDDPERALRATLAIRQAAREKQLAVSVGISTGRVYLGPKSADGSQVTTIGPVVSLATRLQARAAAGQVLVAESTFRHTHAAFEFSPLMVDVASSVGPVKGFELTGAFARPDKVRGIEGMRAELIGRDDDLQQCERALATVLDGKGGMLSIVGDAGIGKSRLVEELCRAAEPAGRRGELLWLSSRCSEFSNSIPYAPFVDLLGGWLDGTSQPGYTRAQSLTSALDDLVGSGNLSQAKREEIERYLSRLLSLQSAQGDSRTGDARPELVLHQTFRAVNDLLVALARQRPLVAIFEDLHWADDVSLDLLAYLVEAIQSAPILLICIYRPEPPPKLKRLGVLAVAKFPDHYVQVPLRELSPDQSRQMVRSMLQADALPAAIDELLNQVWGNPFFVEETVRGLIETGSLFRSDGEWNASAAGELPVPDSVQSIILSRVDRLAPELKRVLYAAAVIGRVFQPKLLGMILPAGTDVEGALDHLEDSALVYQDRILPEVTYSFKHVLTQETIYRNLTRQQREELHLQAAAAIERFYPATLAEHYEELAHHYAASRAVEKAVEYLVKAGDKSRRAFLNQAAIEYFDRALQLAQTGQPVGLSVSSQIDALTGLGRIYHLTGRPSEAERNLRQAIELGQRAGLAPRALARINYWFGQVLHWQGRYGEEMWLGESGLEALSGREAESVEAAMMTEMIASGSLQRGDRDQFHLLAEKNIQLLSRLPYAEEFPSLFRHILLSLTDQKKTGQAQPWLERLDRLAREQNDRQAAALVHEMAAYQAFHQGRLGDAIAELEQALAVYSSADDSINMWRCLDGIAWVCWLQGNSKQAEDRARQALAIAEKHGFNRIVSESHLTLATISFVRNDRHIAFAEFGKAVQFAQGSDPFWTEWAALYGLGQSSLFEGKKEQAQKHFEQALVHLSPQLAPLGWEQHRWWSLSACILAGLETASLDQESFRSLCSDLEEFKLQHAMPPIPMQWYAEPAMPDVRFERREHSPSGIDGSWIANLKWLDPLGDCSYQIDKGLEVHAANGRDLWYLNTSSPRFTRTISGSFAVETVCSSSAGDRPAIGGLLLRKDESNMLRLVWGTRGESEVSFEGCVDDADLIVGRGRLILTESGRVWLCLERLDDQVRALASSDGREWLTLGQISFPVADPVEIGIHAVGWIDRTVYPGDYPLGTAIRFESFEVKKEGGT